MKPWNVLADWIRSSAMQVLLIGDCLGIWKADALVSAERGMPEAFFRIVTAAMPHLITSTSGRVVAVSSFVAHVFDIEGLFPATAAAKASLEALAKSLAVQLAADGCNG